MARVDFAEPVDKEAESDAEDTIDRENENRGDRYQRQDSLRDSINVYIDTISPTATYQSVNANTNHKTFGKYTTEFLPHVDHYRNLLSATNALKSRPTLAELHEEKVWYILHVEKLYHALIIHIEFKYPIPNIIILY